MRNDTLSKTHEAGNLPRRASDEHKLVDVAGLELGVLEDALHGLEAPQEGGAVELLEAGARQREGEVAAVGERLDVDLGGLRRGEDALQKEGDTTRKIKKRHGKATQPGA